MAHEDDLVKAAEVKESNRRYRTREGARSRVAKVAAASHIMPLPTPPPTPTSPTFPPSRVQLAARRRNRRGGFTLLETMLALVIIGVGVLAFVDAQTSFIRSNNWSSHAATGMLLANEVRELSRRLPRHDPVTGLTLLGSGPTAIISVWGREGGEVDIDDIDDLDDLSNVVFGPGGTFPGPINAIGELIQEISAEGELVFDEDGGSVPLEGWSQRVTVEKVDPYNMNLSRTVGYEQAPNSQLPFIRVDQFPLRITVSVRYQGINDPAPEEVTKLTWVVVP